MTAPRVSPCATCPYRRDVASGVWDAEEYAKLPRYDEETFAQPVEVFCCHSDPACLCAGWVAHWESYELLALRIGIARGTVDPESMRYRTDVPLFASGMAAAEHGIADIEAPSEAAYAAIMKIRRRRELGWRGRR